MSKVRKQKYVCSDPDCGAEDFLKLWPDKNAPVAINCYSCKAGMKLNIEQMIAKRAGMFPVVEP